MQRFYGRMWGQMQHNRREGDTLLNEINEGVKCIHRVMGIIDAESELELRQDFVFLRGLRERRIKDYGTVRQVGVATLITGFLYGIWDWIQYLANGFHR